MSGTSCDGVDAALVQIDGRGLDMRVKYLAHCGTAYNDDLRRRLLETMAPAVTRTETLAALNMAVGEAFAECARDLLARTGCREQEIAAIGSHGQTVCHMPDDAEQPATLQIGEPAVIAARTGIAVVADFRQSDVAVGGQGAPLVPWTDYVLFRSPQGTMCIQNIGGIANVTGIPPGAAPQQVVAFDSGPGCMVIDELMRRHTAGRQQFDPDGREAARGTPQEDIVSEIMQQPFFRKPPPKSAGREQFGQDFVSGMLRMARGRELGHHDWLATATLLTARSIAHAYRTFLNVGRGTQAVLCGGGARNAALVGMLRRELPELTWRGISELGIPEQAKECVSFAMLAAAALDGVAANLPQVTGARQAAILGKIVRV